MKYKDNREYYRHKTMCYTTYFWTLTIKNTRTSDHRNILASRPGTASILIPNDGIAQEWITSADVTKKRKPILQGTTKGLSTSNRRLSLILNYQ